MIVVLLIVAIFVFKFPHIAWVSAPICVLYLVLKSVIKEKLPKREAERDEFDWWQDNQGL